MSSVSGLILVGGASSRMGVNKALLEVGGATLLERVLRALSPICSEILLVANDATPYRNFSLPLVHDIEPGRGPLMGLYSGLKAAAHEVVIVVACDMPFASTELLRHLVSLADGYDVVVPETDDGLHPLCAVYRRTTCLPAIAESIGAGRRRMIAFFSGVRVRTVSQEDIASLDHEGLALMNVNTPEDLASARRWAAAQNLKS